ncbi:MAG: nitrite reductase (NAD(P)H) small subunit [Rubrobacter sp.]|nr:nitrite reductase (NAD(P)H) small subunit [Rubrobacter sp.]MDQ3638527.1 nitrite reductase (NAD(P)H) small subunit [Actinomycetota bacterium]
MSNFVEVCAEDDVPHLEGRRVVINGFYVGIFNTEEGFYAIGEVCPHMGGPLADGDVAATTVSCPLHARKIEMKTGEVENDDLSRVLTFPVKVEEGKILVDAEILDTQPEMEEEEDQEDQEEEHEEGEDDGGEEEAVA